MARAKGTSRYGEVKRFDQKNIMCRNMMLVKGLRAKQAGIASDS
jgi:hypothetical protein